MDYDQASCSLSRLLGVNVSSLCFTKVRKLVQKRRIQWHPDKNPANPEAYKEEFLELQEAWKVFCKGDGENNSSQSTTGSRAGTSEEPDLHCYEDMDFDWDKDAGASEAESDYNDTPFDDDFFNPSPKKGFAVPECLGQFFRSKSNRRAGKCFALFSTAQNSGKLSGLYNKLNHYMSAINCFAAFNIRTNKDIFCVLINYATDHRLGDVKKEARKFDILPHELVYAVKLNKFYEYLVETYGEPFYAPSKPSKTAPSRPETNKFNHKQIVDFAKSHQISDALELMYDYAHLADPCDYPEHKITKEHEEDHENQVENAKIFIHLSDRRKTAKNAMDSVFAELYMQCKREKPSAFIDRRCKDLGDRLQDIDDEDIFGLADYYRKYHVYNFDKLAKIILDSFIYGIPRKRYTIIRGDFKCGKSSLASGFNKLFEGVNINVNVDKGRLPFYLGNAIGKRFVLFDDVKGSVKHRGDTLYSGMGFHNLDDLRDHLDGHMEVQLEKKNQQPISQVFPPGIITCNKYVIPESILERVQGPKKMVSSPRWEIHPVLVTEEIIYIACVIANLLPASPSFHTHVERKRQDWWRKHTMNNCDCIQVSVLFFLNYGSRCGYRFSDRGRDYFRSRY